MDRAEFVREPEHVVYRYLEMGFDPLEADAMAENWMHRKREIEQAGYGYKFKCVECGKEDDYNTAVGCAHGVIMAAESVCFKCSFWLLYCRIPHPHRAIIGGKHYVCYPREENERQGYNRNSGFGGDQFVVAYFDGRIVESLNTWHQGNIPQHFRHILKDNAVFAKRNAWKEINPCLN